MMGYGWDGGGWGWGAWVLMAVMMVLFWSAIVAVAVMFFRHHQGGQVHHDHGPLAPQSRHADSQDQALRILDERFARGEIDTEEYTQRRDLIRRQ